MCAHVGNLTEMKQLESNLYADVDEEEVLNTVDESKKQDNTELSEDQQLNKESETVCSSKGQDNSSTKAGSSKQPKGKSRKTGSSKDTTKKRPKSSGRKVGICYIHLYTGNNIACVNGTCLLTVLHMKSCFLNRILLLRRGNR